MKVRSFQSLVDRGIIDIQLLVVGYFCNDVIYLGKVNPVLIYFTVTCYFTLCEW